MSNLDIKTLVMAGLGSVVVALLTGKAIRRILLLPFKWIASRTKNKQDDIILQDAEEDLGLDSTEGGDKNVEKR